MKLKSNVLEDQKHTQKSKEGPKQETGQGGFMPIEYKDQEYKESKAEILRRQSIERFLKFDQEKMISLFNLPHDEETMSIQFLGQT